MHGVPCGRGRGGRVHEHERPRLRRVRRLVRDLLGHGPIGLHLMPRGAHDPRLDVPAMCDVRPWRARRAGMHGHERHGLRTMPRGRRIHGQSLGVLCDLPRGDGPLARPRLVRDLPSRDLVSRRGRGVPPLPDRHVRERRGREHVLRVRRPWLLRRRRHVHDRHVRRDPRMRAHPDTVRARRRADGRGRTDRAARHDEHERAARRGDLAHGRRWMWRRAEPRDRRMDRARRPRRPRRTEATRATKSALVTGSYEQLRVPRTRA